MKRYFKLSNQEKENLLQEFCEAISVLNTPQEIMNFLTDLLTSQEVIMLAKRIKAAKFLIEGKNYKEIQESLKMGQSTIAKVNQWLMESGEGFRIIASRTKKKEPEKISAAKQEWRKTKRRYPIAFWPQLLIEDIIKTMTKRQKDKIKTALKKLDRKSDIYKNINRILN